MQPLYKMTMIAFGLSEVYKLLQLNVLDLARC